MYKISGNFTNGERYTDSFNNQSEFRQTIKNIYDNEACCIPDTIVGKKSKDKLPAYLKNYIDDPETSIKYRQIKKEAKKWHEETVYYD